MKRVRITIDYTSLVWLEELEALLSAFADVAEKPIDLVDAIRDLSRRTPAIDLNVHPTADATECRIVLQPCEALLCLMTALRAFYGDFELIDSAPKIAG